MIWLLICKLQIQWLENKIQLYFFLFGNSKYLSKLEITNGQLEGDGVEKIVYLHLWACASFSK